MLNRHGPINVPAFPPLVFIHSEKGGTELPRNNIILRSLKRNVTGSERTSHLHRYSSIPITSTSLSTHLSLIAETNMNKLHRLITLLQDTPDLIFHDVGIVFPCVYILSHEK